MRGKSKIELYGMLINAINPHTGELVNAYTDDDGITYALIAVYHHDTVHRDFWQIKIPNQDRNANLTAMQKMLHATTAGEWLKVIGEPYIESNQLGKYPSVKPFRITKE